ncbi:MAG: hypothetical protein WKF59_13070 [Chitinophagaceae bacterium]
MFAFTLGMGVDAQDKDKVKNLYDSSKVHNTVSKNNKYKSGTKQSVSVMALLKSVK